MTEFKPDETTGSLDTNIRLLAQRVNLTEKDLHRLGDTVRHNTRELQAIQAEVKAADSLLGHRLKSIEDDAKELSNRVWIVILSMIGTVTAIGLEFLLKR